MRPISRVQHVRSAALLSTLMIGAFGCGTIIGNRHVEPSRPNVRSALIARAQVWRPTNIATMDLETGPKIAGAFSPRATVRCEFVDKDLEGNSPKFACRIGARDEVKVKFGGTNGEVYGEVLATRLLWAIGFGADAMYPVNVICHGCPKSFGGIARPGNEFRFEPAVIERKMDGLEWD